MISILDAIGPFFIFNQDKVTNWSKIPFLDLEKNGILEEEKMQEVEKNFIRFLEKAKELGATAISLDDLAHLVDFSFYDEKLQHKIRSYKFWYQKFFAHAQKAKLKIFITTDICFSNATIEKYFSVFQKDFSDLLFAACADALQKFSIEGIIFRLGETDGLDVKGDFLSKLHIKTPEQANFFLKKILPVFEENNKKCIVRTWTVGAHQIGDLAWNEKTYLQTFGNISSQSLIVSMKYGESDFYRFFPKILNPLFFVGDHPKLLEFQTRREREGFGIHPFYTGWEYEEYLRQAMPNKNFAGISVWCQTGGWSKQKNISFLQNSSIWNELNTVSLFQIFQKKCNASAAVDDFFGNDEMKIFLRKFRDAFIKLVYIEGFSHESYYFRRLRLPPLLWIFWDHILISPFLSLVHELEKGHLNLPSEDEILEILELGKKLRLQNIGFQVESLRVLSAARRVLGGKGLESDLEYMRAYEKKYPEMYEFTILEQKSFSTVVSVWIVKKFLRLIVRKTGKYRRIDKILLSPWCMKIVYKMSQNFLSKKMPAFVNTQAMDISTVLVD